MAGHFRFDFIPTEWALRNSSYATFFGGTPNVVRVVCSDEPYPGELDGALDATNAEHAVILNRALQRGCWIRSITAQQADLYTDLAEKARGIKQLGLLPVLTACALVTELIDEYYQRLSPTEAQSFERTVAVEQLAHVLVQHISTAIETHGDIYTDFTRHLNASASVWAIERLRAMHGNDWQPNSVVVLQEAQTALDYKERYLELARVYTTDLAAAILAALDIRHLSKTALADLLGLREAPVSPVLGDALAIPTHHKLVELISNVLSGAISAAPDSTSPMPASSVLAVEVSLVLFTLVLGAVRRGEPSVEIRATTILEMMKCRTSGVEGKQRVRKVVRAVNEAQALGIFAGTTIESILVAEPLVDEDPDNLATMLLGGPRWLVRPGAWSEREPAVLDGEFAVATKLLELSSGQSRLQQSLAKRMWLYATLKGFRGVKTRSCTVGDLCKSIGQDACSPQNLARLIEDFDEAMKLLYACSSINASYQKAPDRFHALQKGTRELWLTSRVVFTAPGLAPPPKCHGTAKDELLPTPRLPITSRTMLQYRRALGYTVQEFSESLGLTATILKNYESGKTAIPLLVQENWLSKYKSFRDSMTQSE